MARRSRNAVAHSARQVLQRDPDAAGPTPEMRHRLRAGAGAGRHTPDPLARLRLSADQLRAALSIRQAFRAVVDGAHLRISDPARLPGPRCRADDNHEIVRLESYRRWCRELRARGLARDVILEVLVDERGCRAVDGRRRLRNGTTAELVRAGLTVYCDIDGQSQTRY